jgi:primosomal protein N' (replication factor Y)
VAAIGAAIGSAVPGTTLCTASPAAARPRSTCAPPRTSRAGRQALVLVPEINLTPQLIERFTRRFAGRRSSPCTAA